MLEINKAAPDFELPDQNGKIHSLAQYKGKKVLLYFYPKDDTPGCTTEACSFRDSYDELSSKLVVLGVSPDSVASHKKFAEKYNLNFPILSDEGHKLADTYEVWGEKKFMGRTYMGVTRASFLIDEAGNLAKIYPKVVPKEHVAEVTADIA